MNNETKNNIIHSCVVCNSRTWKLLFSKYHNIKIKEHEFKFDQNLILCKKCGLTRVLFNDSYNEKYLESYYKIVHRTPVLLENVVKNHNDPRVVNAKNRVEFIKNNTEGKKLLEIGFGDGFTLLESKRQKYQCTGIDLTGDYEDNIRYLKKNGIEIYNENFIHFQIKEKYDIITAFLLLEHLKDPLFFLGKVRECLNDSGYLVIEVPDISNYKNFYSETQLTYEHIYHYTIATLERLLGFVGFELVNFYSPGVSYPFALTASFKKCNEKQLIIFHQELSSKEILKNFQDYFFNMDIYKTELKKYFNSVIEKHSKIAVFGAGNFFEVIINVVGRDKVEFIDFFIDETISKVGTYFYGKKVYNIGVLKDIKTRAILIASEIHYNQIKNKLKKISVESNIYCIQYDVIDNIKKIYNES